MVSLEGSHPQRNRHPETATSKFERWILEQGGSRNVSNMVGVHQVTVCAWMRRDSMPSLTVAAKIIKVSKDRLTITDIIEGTEPAW